MGAAGTDVRMMAGESDSAIAHWLDTRLRAALADAGDTADTGTGAEPAITLPGGTTPFPILTELVERFTMWPRLAIWPGDDRLVPEDHPASNVGRIRTTLARTGARIIPLMEGAQPPHFALAWLGMGQDGHVASLFPNTNPRADDPQAIRRLMPDPLPPEAPFERLSLTIPALVNADHLLFVIRGADKRALFEAAGRGEHDLPITRLLRAARCPVTCFC